MAVIIPVVSKFDDKGIKKAQSEFGKLGGAMKGILGAAGIGVGVSAIVDGLKEATKAAAEDVKSQALLANQLKNTVGASDEQIASVEASIKAMQNQAAVADDVIRPAFASLVRATGDVNQATNLTALALDVAAGTGKDLGAVSLALGKAVNGSTTSLLKLVPSIKGASDPMAELAKQFAGAAEEAAKNDPFQQLTIVMGDLQEQIGMYLLPVLQEFASWLTDSTTQDGIETLIEQFGNWVEQLALAADGVVYLSDQAIALGNEINSLFSTLSGDFESTPFTDFLGWLADRASEALNPLQNLLNILIQYGLIQRQTTKMKPVDETSRLANRFKPKTKDKPYKPTNPSDTADKAAKAAADKAAKERAKIIKAAQEAAAKAKSAFDDLKKSVDDFNTSFAKTADAFKVVFKFSAPLGEFEQQAVDAFDSMRQAAQDAFDQGLIQKSALTSLKAYADREQVLLQGIAKQRDQLAKKISIAQAVTNSVMGSLDINSMLESETKQVTRSVTSIVNGIALTTTQTFDEVVTSGLADSFKKLVDKTKTFASNLIKLKALGLNGQLFKQIVDAGATTGGATAEAIIAGGADAVKELNGLFGQLTDAGASIAETATPVMYALGEDMTNSFIDGLRSQDQVLISQASAMAALFTSSFQTQLSSSMAPTINASAKLAGMGMDNTDFFQGYGRVTGYGTNPSGGSVTNNITVNAGVVANKQELPQIIVDALGTYTKQSGAGGLTRVLGL